MCDELNIIFVSEILKYFRREGVNDAGFISLVVFVLETHVPVCIYRVMFILLNIYTGEGFSSNKEYRRSYTREWALNISTTMISPSLLHPAM